MPKPQFKLNGTAKLRTGEFKRFRFIALTRKGETFPCFSPSFDGNDEQEAMEYFMVDDMLSELMDNEQLNCYVCEV